MPRGTGRSEESARGSGHAGAGAASFNFKGLLKSFGLVRVRRTRGNPTEAGLMEWPFFSGELYCASFPSSDDEDESQCVENVNHEFDHELEELQQDMSVIRQKSIIAKKNIASFKNVANKIGQLAAVLVFVSLVLATQKHALGKSYSLEWKINIFMIVAYSLFILVLETRQYTKKCFGVDDVIDGFEKCITGKSIYHYEIIPHHSLKF